MGYTHYWTFKKNRGNKASDVEKLYQKAVKECNDLIFKVAKGQVKDMDKISLSGYSAHSKTYGGIKFNGARENAHEDFYLREHFTQNFDDRGYCLSGFNFCKTAYKEYDIVVVACLTILSYRLGDLIDVSSDGESSDWIDGIMLAEKVTGLKLTKKILRNKNEHPINQYINELTELKEEIENKINDFNNK